tara:strand:- start:2180 stop:4120 length:1941 start_codon:yes stop_codon:yes gene_type:complete
MIINKPFSVVAFGVAIVLQSACSHNDAVSPPANSQVLFEDVSESVGLVTEANWKYGGPAVVDLNNDGHYDFLLTNHDNTPVQLFMGNADDRFSEVKDIFHKADLHGISAGDYDADGDNDILLSLGGGNGLTPQPQRLLRNDNGTYTDVTKEAGISKLGARGRSVRWVDLDNDGDLDFMQVNAAKVVNETLPRNIIFKNLGNGTFRYVESPGFEDIEAERVLITDYNNDDVMDIIAFTSYDKTSIWQGNGDFTFTNTTSTVFPQGHDDYPGTITVAQADIDNDGDLDYYFARGKLYYTIANNSLSFDKEHQTLDLRDVGSKSHDGLTLYADSDLTLNDFYHFPRAKLLDFMPVFIGANKQQITTPKEDHTVTQEQAMGFPTELNETGWYLGYLGDNKWRLEWMLTDDLAWDVRASLTGVKDYEASWKPQDLAVPDVLLRNDNGVFSDISERIPDTLKTNNWGVTTGDFNNDGNADFFVYRFGDLKRRIADVMLLNTGDGHFTSSVAHNATTEIDLKSHGDSGVAFDFDLDGKIDILSGDDDNGKWHLYKNVTDDAHNNHLLVKIGYSKNGVDPYGAKVWITTKGQKQYKLIGSSNASHSQSLLNIAHFGLGKDDVVTDITVLWRDGTTQTLKNQQANQLLTFGKSIF